MFGKRLMSSVVLVIIALVTLWQGGGLLLAVLYVISLFAYNELSRACGIHTPEKPVNALETVGYAGITIYYAALYSDKMANYRMMILILTVMALLFVYVFAFPKFQAGQVMAALFCVMYAPLMLSFIYLTRELTNGGYLVWMIFISSWVCDTFAYLAGRAFGRHKLAPVLSPKKSVEGAVGGALGSALAGALFGCFFMEQIASGQQIIWVFALIGTMGGLISMVGDLAASAIKRNHDIKDFGRLIPGHGGIMDRFDSVIFTAPVIYYLALIFIS